MPKAADIGSKRLISLAPDAWVKWVTQSSNVSAREILAAEFQWISRESDVVVKAYSPQIGEFLVLNELQLRYTNRMPRRMRAYAALAEERYNLPVYPVLINILQPTPGVAIANRYESQVLELKTFQEYRIINLWQVDAEVVFQQPLPSLLPFVPILRGGGEVSVVQQAVQVLRANEQLSELEPLLAFFATFVLETPLVQQILRWDMAILRESPWYQEILKEGEQRGEQRGLRQGLLSGIELALELKFGAEGLELMPEISQIQDVGVLRAIQEGLRTINSLDELREIYRVSEA
jgi:predicted transposase YdaD